MSRRQFGCPYCGLLIVVDDAALVIMHEEPECARFLERVAEHGGSAGVRVEEPDIEAHLAHLAANVARRTS